ATAPPVDAGTRVRFGVAGAPAGAGGGSVGAAIANCRPASTGLGAATISCGDAVSGRAVPGATTLRATRPTAVDACLAAPPRAPARRAGRPVPTRPATVAACEASVAARCA